MRFLSFSVVAGMSDQSKLELRGGKMGGPEKNKQPKSAARNGYSGVVGDAAKNQFVV